MDSIKKLTELFAKFPTVGPRTAGRFVFYLINQPKEVVNELMGAIQELKKNIIFCTFCFQPFESITPEGKFCTVCSDTLRNRQQLCIIEKENDLLSIEHTKKYKGLYFILGGTITLRKTEGDHLRIEELKQRIAKNNFTEIIIALNPTPEGKSTSVLIQRAIKEAWDNLSAHSDGGSRKITHLAKGLPVGGELEYADEETLESAFEGRK